MAKTRLEKEETVIKLTEKLQKAKTVVFINYQGMTMKHLSELRNKLREIKSEFIITKNTLLERALPASIRQPADLLPASSLEGPTAVLFAYEDETSPLKILVKTLKDLQIGQIKLGFVAGQLLDSLSLLRLAQLPTKSVLQGQVVGLVASPLIGMVTVLGGNLRNLVYTLDQIRIQKGGE